MSDFATQLEVFRNDMVKQLSISIAICLTGTILSILGFVVIAVFAPMNDVAGAGLGGTAALSLVFLISTTVFIRQYRQFSVIR